MKLSYDLYTPSNLENRPITQGWIQLPTTKSFKVYLAIADSMTATLYVFYSAVRMQYTLNHTIDYTNARIPVIAYKSETKMTGDAP